MKPGTTARLTAIEQELFDVLRANQDQRGTHIWEAIYEARKYVAFANDALVMRGARDHVPDTLAPCIIRNARKEADCGERA